MVELDVGDHGDVDVEGEHRPVGLVGLDHEPVPRPPAGVGAGAADLAADEVARVRPGAAQRVHDHARRRRLAVGAGDRDRGLQAGQLAQQVRAVHLGLAALGVGGRDRARVDDLGRFRHVRAVMADRGLDPGRAQRRAEGRAGRAVGAGDARSERMGDDGEAAHPGSADPHKVQSSS
jgi:hypothetical protein